MKKLIGISALAAAILSTPASAEPAQKFCNFMGNWNGILTAIFHGAPFTCVYR